MEKDKRIVHAFNFELGRVFNILDGLPSNSQKYTWLCTICKKPLFYNKEMDCFLHKGYKNYCFEPETLEHKTMKAYWYVMFPRFNQIFSKKIEHRIGDQIADVYFELSSGEKVVIECQNSQISKRKLIERTKNYSHKDIYTLWIFNGHGTCVSYKKNPQNEEGIGVLGMEKRVHSLYGGRIYYMNVSGRNIVDSPYAIHFSPFFKHKKSDYNYLGYNKYYKDKRSVVLSRIPSYKILCREVKGYKLARFTDKHVSVLCTEEIISTITQICKQGLLEGKSYSDRLEIPLKLIISHLKDRYGLHLPSLLLKKSQKIMKVNIEKIIDENYGINDIITVLISDYV